MINQANDLRLAQNLVARLARHVAIELDLNYGNLDATAMAEELADLQQAVQMMTNAGMPVAGVVSHVLGKAGLK